MSRATQSHSIELYAPQEDLLGEGPLWSQSEQTLYWINIGRKVLYSRGPLDVHHRSWSLPDYPGCLAELAPGSLAIAMSEGVQRFDLKGRYLKPLSEAPRRKLGTRFNDGKVDPQGRFWAVTMQNNFGPDGQAIPIEHSDGTLYRFDANGTSHVIEENIGIGNTLAWSPNLKHFYFADSLRGQIFVYDFDAESGAIFNKRLFFETSDHGVPDGSAMDTDGCLWNARWDGGAVLRITPQGKVDRVINLPLQRPTSCAFGGPNLDALFVTSARLGLQRDELRRHPHSGSTFAITGLAQGVPVPPYSFEQDIS